MEPRDFAEQVIQSKGRAPSVFVFNPFAEGRIARGASFTPVKTQQMLAEDLANLPQFLCRQGDIVLLPKRPSVEFLSAIKEAGFALPEFIELKDEAIDPASSLSHRKLNSLRPWAWGPDSVELLQPLFANVTGEDRVADQCFNGAIARLYSKAWSAAFLRKVLSRWTGEPWMCTQDEVGVVVDTLDGALEAIAVIRQRGHHKVLAKEAIGLAGHNSIRLWEPDVLEKQQRWMANAVENGRRLVIEPWLERESDFSVQLEMGPDGLRLCGYTGLINDPKGQFQANWAAANYERRIPTNVAALFGASFRPRVSRREEALISNPKSEIGNPKSRGLSARLQALYDDIRLLLGDELRRAGYVGPVGIDSFVYRTVQGESRLKPIVEINPRYTMGRLLVALMKQTYQGSHGLFRLVNRAMARAEGFDNFVEYARSLHERFPLSLEGEPVPRIREGALCLNDPARAQVCLAVFQVSRTLDTLCTLCRQQHDGL